jgi:hypothetical protein
MIEVVLRCGGLVALVDEADLPLVSSIKWYPAISGRGIRKIYARANLRENGARSIAMHRLILGLKKNDEREVDHINGSGLDNRRQNLRICTRSENSRNRRNIVNKHGLKGVSFDHRKKKPWRAQIVTGDRRKPKGLGYFTTKEEAASAYDHAARKYFSEFAATNLEAKPCPRV